MTHYRYFYTTRKGDHSATLVQTVVCGRRPLPSEICAQSDPPPFEKRRLRPISAHNVSTVGDSEKSSITTNINSTTGFPTSHRWIAYVTLSALKGGSKSDFFVFTVRLYVMQRTVLLSELTVRLSVRCVYCDKTK